MSHIHEKIDFTTQALIVHGEKVLLRKHEKYNIWLGVGGHIELDEDPVQALQREVKEECGLEFEIAGPKPVEFNDGAVDLPPPHFLHKMFVVEGHQHVDMLYVALAKTLNIQPDAAEKKTEFKWFTKEELRDPRYGVQPRIQYFASRAIEIANQPVG